LTIRFLVIANAQHILSAAEEGSLSSPAAADGTLREPCPHCAEPIPLEAKLCHHCQSDVLVDVVLHGPIADGRQRYQIARGLHALPGSPGLSAIQGALGGTPPAAVRGVTRAFARDVAAFLLSSGIKSSLDTPRRASDRTTGSSRSLPLLGGLSVAALLAVGYFGWRTLSPPDEDAVLAPSTGAPVAAPVAADASDVLTAVQIAERSLPSAVSIRCRNSVGSGFFIGPDLVMTNAHVLCQSHEPIQVILSDDRKLSGVAERSDSLIDLGLVRVRGANERALPLGDVSTLAPGEKVTIIGSPVGLEFTVHEGSVSSLQRATRGVAYIQLDAKINPGNSGGPVIDSRGRVVGIVTLKVQAAEGIGLAVPINYAYTNLGYAPPPSREAARSAAFAKMVERAQAQASSGGSEGPGDIVPSGVDAFEDHPLLVAAFMDEYQRLVARLIRVTPQKPRYEEVALKVWRGTDHFCTLKGDVSSWKELDSTNAPRLMSPQLLQALGQRHLFMGESPLRWDLCNRDKMVSGVEIELIGGHPNANRLVLQSRAPSYGGRRTQGY
jgi:S1-C subfamily serine protease